MKWKWVALSVVVTLLVAGAVGYFAYSSGVKKGQTQLMQARNAFMQNRGTGQMPVGMGNNNTNNNNNQTNAPGRTGNMIMGQVKAIDGNTIEVSTQNDQVLRVNVNDQTQLMKMDKATLSDLQTGMNVTVQGQKGEDGSYTASFMQIGNDAMGNNAPPQPKE